MEPTFGEVAFGTIFSCAPTERAWQLNVCREISWFSHLFLENDTMITAPDHSKTQLVGQFMIDCV